MLQCAVFNRLNADSFLATCRILLLHRVRTIESELRGGAMGMIVVRSLVKRVNENVASAREPAT
jgi:hypothetical protein